MRPRSILYIGQLTNPGSTTLQRMRCLQRLGHRVYPFDVEGAYREGWWLRRGLRNRLAFGPGVWALNRRILEFARGLAYDWVWVDKGIWIQPSTLSGLRARGGVELVLHFTPDVAFRFNPSRHFEASLPLYDLCVTTKAFEVPDYEARIPGKVVLARQGYDDELFTPEGPAADDGAEAVVFVGHHEPHYGRCLRAVHDAGLPSRVWGHWGRARWTQPWIGEVWQGGGVYEEGYAAVLRGAGLALGLLSKHFPETATTRSYEIPACGAMLLAERTEEHQELYEEDREAVFFGSPDELVDKARHYLGRPDERARIAAAGRARCERSGYSNLARISSLLDVLARALGERGAVGRPGRGKRRL